MLSGLLIIVERPLTVRVLVSPTLIVVGSKAQVAPEEQESEILSAKELAADAETVYVGLVSDASPIWITVDRLLIESAKTAFAIPASDTARLPPAALLAMVSVPVRLPLVVGVNVMLTEQPSPAFSALGKSPQVFVSSKSPEMLMSERMIEALPVFIICTTWAGLLSPTVS
jgi:hypothetical protein